MNTSAFFSIYLLLVLCSALLDIVANLLLAKSDGFKKKGMGFLALVMVGGAFNLLFFDVNGIDLFVAYALW